MDKYSNHFTRIITNLRDLEEILNKYGAILRLLKSIPKEFDALILLLELTSDLNIMRLEEAFEQVKVHELRLQERESRDEERALLPWYFIKSKKHQRGSSSSERGC